MVPMRAYSSSVAAPAEPCSLQGLASATFFGLLLLGLLVGCSGGGDSGGSPPGGSGNIISGTAATGDPITLGTITIKDSLGVPRSTVTDRYGNYSFNVAGTTPPFILKAVPKAAGSVPLYSFADKSGTTNITPLTDLVLYEALGRSDIGTVFDSGDLSKLTINTVSAAESMVRSNISPQLTANGLSLKTDLFHMQFDANGTGYDALIQSILPSKVSTGVYITGSGGLCAPYGNGTGITFAIDGLNGLNPLKSDALLGLLANVSPIDGLSTVGYVKEALAKCLAGEIDDVPWTGTPNYTDTRQAVEQLKIKLRNAYKNNRDAVSRGEKGGPINIVAHSWGAVIAYVALKELDEKEKSLVRVQNLITMGSPVQYFSFSGCAYLLPLGICEAQDRVPEIREKLIKMPATVINWTNFYNPGDIISSAIGDDNRIVSPAVEDCPTPPVNPITVPTCSSHSVYFDMGVTPVITPTGIQSVPPPTTAPTLLMIQNLISQSQASSSPVASATSPGTFTVTAGTPYCDTREPVGPAVKLTWPVSTNASFYRVFRDGKATGVQLGSSQLDFGNELGLVAGQSYSYMIKATNASGERWSSPAQVTIPADVCSLNFTSPSPGTITTSAVGYQPTLTVSGNVTQVSFSWSGATSGGPTTWVKNDANWLSKVTANPDGSITLRPVVTQTGDPAGITNWTVTIRDSTGATRAQSFSVNYQSTVPGGGGSTLLPDLRVLNGAVSPSSVSAGGAVSVSWTLVNQGTGTANASTTVVRINQSSTNALGTNLAFNTPSLAAGGSQPQATNLTVPTTAGTYYVWVLADNFNTSGQSTSAAANDIVLIGSFVVPGGGGSTLLPDLVVDTVTATPTSAAPGASVTVTFTVRNQGAGAVAATVARIRLASGTTIQPTDPLLAEVTVPGLAAGVTNTQSRTVTVPAGTSAGNYFMGMTANAPDGAPAESNNNNNQRTTPFTVAGGGGTGPSLPQPFTLPNATAQCDLNTPVGPAVRLNWFASGNATSYEVYRNDTLIPASVNNTTLTFYNSSGLTAGQTYTYKVVARNATGTIDSNTITVSIPSTICGSPARTVTIANTGGIELNLRNGPGENFSVLRALPEGTQMSVVGGPTLANGMTWWNLTDSQGTGWSAVAEWLTPLTPALNSQVTVTFTGNIGLRLRQCAGVSCTLITTLPEGTTMTVIAGPVSANGYTWWNLTGPMGTGWSAVGNWLTPNPRS